MNQLINLLLAATAMCCLLCTCSQQEPLPQNTQTGQNTLGCLIDGKPYVPDGGKPFSGIKPIYGGFFVIQDKPKWVGVYVRAYASDKQQIRLYLNDFALGKHQLNQNLGIDPASLYAALYPKDFGLYESSEGNTYATSSSHTGYVNLIKADTTSGIVSGTFEFQAVTLDGKTVSVTNGRFDVNVRTQ